MITVSYTGEFKRSLRQLIKKYVHIRNDIEPVIQQLQQGELLGDRIQHGTYIVYKVRVRNSDAQRGKSGGYRVIYYLKQQTDIVLLTVYSKSEQADISNAEIKRIIKTAT
ncbi:addiction module antitoxin [Crenothrix sp. D3]|nr:addiction module antitoxin [Crenothrix sp. D3]